MRIFVQDQGFLGSQRRFLLLYQAVPPPWIPRRGNFASLNLQINTSSSCNILTTDLVIQL